MVFSLGENAVRSFAARPAGAGHRCRSPPLRPRRMYRRHGLNAPGIAVMLSALILAGVHVACLL